MRAWTQERPFLPSLCAATLKAFPHQLSAHGGTMETFEGEYKWGKVKLIAVCVWLMCSAIAGCNGWL